MSFGINPFFVILIVVPFIVPLLVIPSALINPFNAPKTVFILVAAASILGLYLCRICTGREVNVSRACTPTVIIVLIFLNGFSLLYTTNPYYTSHAVVLNASALCLFYFASLYVTPGRSPFILISIAGAGVLVALESALQFFNVFILFRLMQPNGVIIGTIGNSNYLGSYLIFPLFALAALSILYGGKTRLIMAALFFFVLWALIISRARSAWFGFFPSFLLFLLVEKRIYSTRLIAKFRNHRLKVVLYGLAILLVLTCLWYVAPQRLYEMINAQGLTDSLSLKLRVEKYGRSAMWLFKQGPIFGTGLWSYRDQVFEAQAGINLSDPCFFENYPQPKPEAVHNEYLEALVDGGLVMALALLVFLVVHLTHARRVISDDKTDLRIRVMAAATTCSTIAVLFSAVFFFPFRVNTTLVTISLTMGLTEGLYLHSQGLIATTKARRSRLMRVVVAPTVISILLGVVWFKGIRPFQGELEYFRHKAAAAVRDSASAERHLKKAIAWDPNNTLYNFSACQMYMNLPQGLPKALDYIEKAINHYNGDIVRWALYDVKGILNHQAGNLLAAQAAYERALYYNPQLSGTRQRLELIKQIIQEHKHILIEIRK